MLDWWKKRQGKMKPEDAVHNFLAIADGLITAQLITGFPNAKDAFSSIITNKLAMGYVFGLFDSLLQKFKLLDPYKPEVGLYVMHAAYKKIFDEFGGNALFEMSKTMQADPEFQKGRMNGGSEVVDFLENKIPPLGLSRIVLLGMQE